ncbi:hypothetical protein [Streptomyces sp. NPDC058677]|uniref:hypothetical protein n=1 Tax=Streptomyces sp. NPDC058677 TaxID=3346594 RepID=UPI003651CF1E
MEVLLMRAQNPEEFLSKLSANELPEPREMTIVGMVKIDEEDSSVIKLTRSPSCEKWLSLPIAMVESFTHLKNVSCKDHEHPLTIVKLKRPDEARPEMVFLWDLCSQLRSTASRARRGASTRSAFRRYARDAMRQDDCAIVSTPDGLDICCYEEGDNGDEVVCYEL